MTGKDQERATTTTSADDQYLLLCVRGNKTATIFHHRNFFAGAIGMLVSTSTLRRRIHGVGRYVRRAAICMPLTLCHKREHLSWARDTGRLINGIVFSLQMSPDLASKFIVGIV